MIRREKSLLFFSYNKHQYTYFDFLARQTADKYRVFNFNIHKFAIRILCFNLLYFYKKAEVKVTREELNEIINYSYKKAVTKKSFLKNRFFKVLLHKFLGWAAKLIINYLSYYLLENDVNMIVIWNGLQYSAAAAAKVASKLRIKTVFMENGYLPETLTVDPQGVNNYNSLADKNYNFYKKVDINEKGLQTLKNKGIKNTGHDMISTNDFSLPDKYIFIPFQVQSDTQILIHSPLVKNMEHFFNTVYKRVEKINKRSLDDYWLIAKEHPAERENIDYKKLRNKYKNKKVIILKQYSTEELIKNSKLVITINSTVGIESLIYKKPVVTLGEAFYNIKDMVYHVNNLNNLYSILVKALAEDVDQEIIDKFIYFLGYKYLVNADKKNMTVEGNKEVIQRIDDLLQGVTYNWM